MINLLPKENQKQLRLSFYNVHILNILFLSLLLFLIIVFISIISISSLKDSEKKLNSEIELVNKNDSYKEAKNKANEIVKKMENAEFIFKNQKHYSNFLIELANSIPEYVEIDRITIEPNFEKKPATFLIKLNEYNKAIETKHIMENSDLINSVDINSISKIEKDKNEITVRMTVMFNQKRIEEVLKWRK